MIKRISDFLAGLPMTLVGGIFLAGSFFLPRIGFALPVDPAWMTVVICGIPLAYLAVWRLLHNPGISRISSALLITIAMAAAAAIGDIFAAGEVAFIMAIGAILEEMTTNRAKKGIQRLIRLAPVQGRRLRDGREELIPAADIRQGDVLRVLPGETVPVDGTILSGKTSVDQSIMTGESLPVDKGVGDEVFCGTINRFGAVDIQASKVGQDSSLQKLIPMVEEPERRQAPMQRIADKWASWLVPVALLIALAAYIGTKNIVTAVTVLVVFCPCALVLATPTAIMAAIGQATKQGVMIKSGEALERMGAVDTIAFDKTGTLTKGCLTVSDVIPVGGKLDERGLLALAASVEARSEHPLGKAIAACGREKRLSFAAVEDFSMAAGRGVSARVEGKRVCCGTPAYLAENGAVAGSEVPELLTALRDQGKAAVLVSEGERCVGIIALSDVLRLEAETVVARLAAMGTGTVLLTGDSPQAAAYFAGKAGVREVRAQLLPEEKVASIQALRREGRRVCMVGDGVNDAPALKTADVSVAMGAMGSDIAVDAADIVLMSDDITKIPYIKRLANAAVRTIKVSITLSMAINFVAIALSLMGVLTPTTGALIHNAGSCFVVLLAALLYDRKLV